ncbi:MAG TPA: NUDIX hydrolase [Anaerovoracaceae bacterium]|nr:NUDIX hydrolase [Anaerovoracaceae bacterium]
MWIGGVRVVIPNEKNEILMVKQHHEGRDIWMVPGGAIEPGENSIEAGIREIKEETGLDIVINGMAWHIEEVSEERGQRFVNYMTAEVVTGVPKLGTDPELAKDKQVMKELRFLSRDEIAKLENVHPSFLNDEIWEILDSEPNGTTYYRLR